MTGEIAIVQTTVASREVADTMARVLIEEQFAVCVHLTEINSVYLWDGEIQRDAEIRCEFKTTVEHLSALVERLIEIHPYDEPEILILSPVATSDGYARYVSENLP
ncbi:divalent-cation tolerance protein CutA [Parvularcula sp. LCG005]|uniref:divalent-cation tolerance protein CutA n=1 Tax=Parvularcula sp. LCG005 TaxID=3078805 RepID=UPI0029423134|nr:divalent-cation tolerance protein CutA [Parvularcula sp. LCG005]WOI53376.1 divalent-cation tolerance protein CutA [Parvularcula sp. LCG005]